MPCGGSTVPAKGSLVELHSHTPVYVRLHLRQTHREMHQLILQGLVLAETLNGLPYGPFLWPFAFEYLPLSCGYVYANAAYAV